MIDGPTPKSPPAPLTLTKLPGELPSPQPSPPARASPMSSTFGSSEGSSSSSSQEYPPPVTDLDGVYYLDPSDARKQAYLPSPTASSFSSNRDSGSSGAVEVPLRPKIIVSDIPVASTLPTSSPMTAGPPPASPRYSGWLAEAVSPLSDFIDEAVDPRATYVDLQEIAEGESGSVFAAVLVEKYADQLRLPLTVRARDKEDRVAGRRTLVAIKQVAVSPEGSQKMKDLRHELHLLRGLAHENILSMDALYVDAVDDYLWIRMDLMERSLADVIELVNDGLMLQERMVARFATDILLGLDYIHKQGIAHRDVRSDNLLINNAGLVRLTDFSNAVKVTPEAPTSSEVVGVIYWQAPEMRIGPYNPLKADIWSLGATTWEAAQAEPPFVESQQIGDRWPSVRQPELFSPAFHEFLRLCSEPAAARPDTATLLKSSFTGNACGRAVIVQLLSQCMSIERRVQEESGGEES
ncbi:kinase-like domain-containing protein [Schizophyllum amplum]|uniref:Kinase-like domain-containing protein n=1 Tax=Schizophyllum amplum TaxID=97359 RepID=A0A550CES4_9AGAR|nr:kinase-like domain-containing protein [Auriculariopsis ampla]